MTLSENLHPFECNGPGNCIHCDRIKTKNHHPMICNLCHESSGGLSYPITVEECGHISGPFPDWKVPVILMWCRECLKFVRVELEIPNAERGHKA